MATVTGGVRATRPANTGITSAGTGVRLSPLESRTLTRLQGELRDDKVESIYVIGANGEVLYQNSGDAGHVSIAGDGMRMMNNKIHLHNHPSGRGMESVSFSRGDLLTSIKGNAKTMRVMTAKYLYILDRPKRGWGTIEAGRAAHDKFTKSTWDKVDRLTERKKVSHETINNLFDHHIFKGLAKEYKTRYKRILIK